jgi:hypothetical protein
MLTMLGKIGHTSIITSCSISRHGPCTAIKRTRWTVHHTECRL